MNERRRGSRWALAAAGATVVGSLLAGCASRATPTSSAVEPRASASTGAAAAPATTAEARRFVALADLRIDKPTPSGTTRVSTAPATRPADPAPSEALALYAQAHALIRGDRRAEAVPLLERAVALDPESAVLHEELFLALRGRDDARSLAALERASELDPADIDLHIELARLALQQDEAERAAWHLLEARRSDDHGQDEPDDAMVDLLLARALQDAGYDQAALESFQSLLLKLDRSSFTFRARPELAFLTQQPEAVLFDIATLQENLGRHDEALRSLEQIQQKRPDNRVVKGRIALVNARLGNADAAEQGAVSLVRETSASRESVDLLRQVFAALGRENDAATALRAEMERSPDNLAWRRALVRTLREQGRVDELRVLLDETATAGRPDLALVGEIVDAYRQLNQPRQAAEVIARALASGQFDVAQLLELYEPLIDPRGMTRLKADDLSAIDAPQSAKDYLQFLGYQARGRPVASREAIDRAMRADPLLAPAFRGAYFHAITSIADASQREARVAEIVELATQRGAAGLASELRGLSLLREGKPKDALAQFELAEQQGNVDPQALLARVRAMQEVGDSRGVERVLWQLVSDHPRLDTAWAGLFDVAIQQRNFQQALVVIRRWLAANPQSVAARFRQATLAAQARQGDAAEQVLRAMLEERPEDPAVLDAVTAILVQIQREAVAVEWLSELLGQDPRNLAAATELSLLHQQKGRLDEAVKVVDAARAALKDRPDSLYFIASLYTRLGRPIPAEQSLRDVLAIDPRHASAANDLGYQMADAGGDLDEAERLIRIAVEAEPDTPAYLDSLGWVLYKRGRFVEAEPYLRQAAEIDPSPDAVVLDHLGDVLLRLGRRDEAIATWKRALERFTQQTEQNEPTLRLRIQNKLRVAEQGGSPEVAPTVAETKP
jgi:tetratricopeptide (TPR) repeat protein